MSLEEITQLTGHDERVWHIAWNTTHPLLASVSADKSLRISHYSPSLVFTPQASIETGHAKSVRCVCWAPSGERLATASFDSNIAVWEQEQGGEWECAALLEGHETECKGVAYNSSGTLLASCSRDKTVWIWEVQPDSDFECTAVLMAHTQDVKCVAWHPSLDILASGSYDNTINLYSSDADGEWYDSHSLSSHSSTVWSLAFSPCGTFLASASDDTTVRIWSQRQREGGGGEWGCVCVLEGHERSVYSVSWSRLPRTKGEDEDEEWVLASAGGDNRINIWSIKTKSNTNTTEAKLLTTTQNAHGPADINCIAWCPRAGFEDVLASAGDDCLVRVWRFLR